MIEKVLAIETSCDDTSVALVGRDGRVFEILSASQDDVHEEFGGIVPELACRNHSFHLLPLIERIIDKYDWDEVDGIAVTNRPGLVGSLIVGLVTAKALAQSLKKPFIGVNHLEGHLLAPFLRDSEYTPHFHWDEGFIALAVSGGHTSLYDVSGLGKYQILGETRDDAAGEAFDKFAKMLGLGFPGGVKVDRLAMGGNPEAFSFPRGLIREESYDFSFSGLKSAAHRLITSKLGGCPKDGGSRIEGSDGAHLNRGDEVPLAHSNEKKVDFLPDVCASFQRAVVDVLIEKLDRAVSDIGKRRVVVTGGVSANSELRTTAIQWAQKKEVALMIPPPQYCTDNAAMIGLAGISRMNRGEFSDLSLGPSPRPLPGDFYVHQK